MRPNPGEFYYHFKHDSTKCLNNHAYEVLGIGKNTEDNEVVVIYRPCYELEFIKEVEAEFCVRPLSMWFDQIDRDGYVGPRFIKIDDAQIIESLKQLQNN